MIPQDPDNLPSAEAPSAFFVGDFNTGKSAIINALLRREAVPTTREESRSLPTFLGRSARKEAYFAALAGADAIEPRTQEEFFAARQPIEGQPPCRALAGHYPAIPFRSLQLVDTGGISGEAHHDPRVLEVREPARALLVVVTDIEYWASKHNMALIARNLGVYGPNLLVVANKADHLNAADIRKVADKARLRMERHGVDPAPRFFTLSARLETARRDPFNEYRNRTKRDVRELCDAGFDAFRVALYEFEAAQAAGDATPNLAQVLTGPLAASFVAAQEGADA